MGEKTCTKCGKTKPGNDFYRQRRGSDARQGRCKDCVRSAATENRLQNLDRARAHDRARGNLPHRVMARAEYQQTERGKAASRAAKRRYAEKNREKREAHILLGNAVRSGSVQRQPCEACGSTRNVQAHHDDYSKPLIVRWLCSKHHAAVHHTRRCEMKQQGLF